MYFVILQNVKNMYYLIRHCSHCVGTTVITSFLLGSMQYPDTLTPVDLNPEPLCYEATVLTPQLYHCHK